MRDGDCGTPHNFRVYKRCLLLTAGRSRGKLSNRILALNTMLEMTIVLAFAGCALNAQSQDRQVSALKQMMSTVNAGDAEGYANLYAEDAVIVMHGSGVLKGRRAIAEHERTLLREFPGTTLAFYAVWQNGPIAMVQYGVNGKTPAGRPMGHEGLLFYRFHASGLIEEERRYLDSLTPMAQLGALGAVPARALPVLPGKMAVHVAKGSRQEQDSVATVRASIAALDATDQRAFLAAVAEDAVFDELIETQPSNSKAWFERWTNAVSDAKTEIVNIQGFGEFVLVEMIVRGTLRGPLGRLNASGKAFSVHRAAVIQLKRGKLSRVSAFMNSKEIAEAVGQWPPARTAR